MNRLLLRRVSIQGAVVCGLCAGAWLLFVRPERAELSEARATLAAQRRLIREARWEFNDGDLKVRAQTLRSEAEAVDTSLEVSGDEARIYAALNEVAARTGVRIEAIEPRRDMRKSARQTKGRAVTSTSFEMSLAGSFENIAAFLGEVERSTGLTRVTACHIAASTSHPDDLSARVQTSHYGLDRPLASTGDGEEP